MTTYRRAATSGELASRRKFTWRLASESFVSCLSTTKRPSPMRCCSVCVTCVRTSTRLNSLHNRPYHTPLRPSRVPPPTLRHDSARHASAPSMTNDNYISASTGAFFSRQRELYNLASDKSGMDVKMASTPALEYGMQHFAYRYTLVQSAPPTFSLIWGRRLSWRSYWCSFHQKYLFNCLTKFVSHNTLNLEGWGDWSENGSKRKAPCLKWGEIDNWAYYALASAPYI